MSSLLPLLCVYVLLSVHVPSARAHSRQRPVVTMEQWEGLHKATPTHRWALTRYVLDVNLTKCGFLKLLCQFEWS